MNYSWGADALATMHDFVVTMMLYVQYICCTIAGVYVIVSVCQIYIKMNTGEDGITKSIMTLVGACLFLIGAFYVSRLSSATAYNLTCIRSQTNKYSLKSKRMFQKTKQLCRKAFGFVNGIPTKVMMFSFMLLSGMVAKAQNSAGDYSAGTSALSTVADEIAKYVPIMVKLCYAIAGVVAIVGAISVYIAMNNEEQDVKKKIMMVVGACIFLIAAAKALPLFFGIAA